MNLKKNTAKIQKDMLIYFLLFYGFLLGIIFFKMSYNVPLIEAIWEKQAKIIK